ncbi:hypothetical protein [Breznakiella homolactica]|uniref:Uncharacterized protein n=1 Tax=Breznakiella homolactica TaxID=2798577 RepID=A0A7T8BC18_9SPIR|nr:hypothetical protein [Breznakiella homolactica]QQO10670.1 hypothetical protein JFL75_07065 [Breznakiella homolactica]
MYAVLGFVSLALFIIVTAPYWFRRLNQWFFHLKGPGFTKFMKGLRLIHKPLGAAFVIVPAIHGYLAMGGFRLHTGTILWFFVVITAAAGHTFYLFKKPGLLRVHRILALVTFCFILVHLFVPNLIYYITA